MHTTVDAWLTRRGDRVTVLITNHAQPDLEIRSEEIELRLLGARAPRGAVIRRVDASHANPKAVWEQIGSPTYPTAETLELLESASAIGTAAQPFQQLSDVTQINFTVPAHALAVVRLDYEPPAPAGTPV
ncbi:GH39 family glycosyl hydrolase [Enhygromyxa salina]|uniref:Glycosyl hydrolases family 39 n=1 Tax=Enhygromyxa salina TaxID=215803 RepID=A0A2S9YD97_9BACT|nr:hypothetical protein [Enhygromyxa salina]PRQ03088.1 Glycosyl hydrolases family 39 [Enhygromyxa salina]